MRAVKLAASVAGLFLLGVVFQISDATADAQPGCRAAFDIGSTGMKVGSNAAPDVARASIDYLADVWANRVLQSTTPDTIKALKELRAKAQVPPGCATVAGGYSAWRYALAQGGAGAMADLLLRLQAETGVQVFVVPQEVEGSYAWRAAKEQAGALLTTPLIWDIGGGSMQISGPTGGWGSPLGQKSWLRRFCMEIRGVGAGTCQANPAGADALDRTLTALAPDVAQARSVLGTGLHVTAVSAPVVRGIHPILRHLAEGRHEIDGGVTAASFTRAALTKALAILSGLDDAGILARLDGCPKGPFGQVCTPAFVGTFVSDMLMVDAFMEGLGIDELAVVSADVTNVPGMLADDRAYAWAGRFDCYVSRLRSGGIDAFTSDPATCARP